MTGVGCCCCRLLHLPHTQVSNGLNDALRRASAERAAQAVFMAPLSLRDDLPVDDLTAKVLTGGQPAEALTSALLLSFNSRLLSRFESPGMSCAKVVW